MTTSKPLPLLLNSSRPEATAAQPQVPQVAKCTGVYVCDLRPDITEADLRQVFGQYGEILSVRQADAAPDDAVIIEYVSWEAAEEAQATVNQATLRGKLCRCMLVTAVEAIRRTMASGQRLIIENLDPAIESPGLWDVCSLFGEVLDCKLQLDDDGKSKGFGFVHYASEDEATQAKRILNEMQVGELVVKLRPFEWDDAALFTGALYARLIYNPYSDVAM